MLIVFILLQLSSNNLNISVVNHRSTSRVKRKQVCKEFQQLFQKPAAVAT
jgi:hypothetical protein